MERYSNFIGGKWVPPATGKYYSRTNPARPAEILGEFPFSGRCDASEAVGAAHAASTVWADTPGPERGAILFRFADLLEASKAELGRIVTLEQGKALCESTGEVMRASAEARFMAGEASRVYGQSYPSERAGVSVYTVCEPLGIVAAICPWNFPVVTPVRKIAPALAYGNAVVFKPASLTPMSAVYVTQLLERAGVPAGVVNLVLGPGGEVGDAIVSDERIRGISFTGSTQIGLGLYQTAARHLASVQLELGGKNPAIVVEYEDLDTAAREIVSAAFLCSGQRCTALSRVIVLEKHADELVKKIAARVSTIQVGDGLLETTTMGPLVSAAQFRTVQEYVMKGIEAGARLVAGGEALTQEPDRAGCFYAPTVFDHVAPDSPLAMEEIFGPVLPVIRVRDVEEAIALANGTPYGLAASVFTSRFDLAARFFSRIQAGMIHLNHGTASQAHVPFGGRKASGQGAFSIGPTAKDFFTNTKVIYAKW